MVMAGPRVGLRFVEQFRYSETVGNVPQDLGCQLRPLRSLGSLFISVTLLQVVFKFRQRCVSSLEV